MPDSFSVSYIRDNMRGAPVINGNTPGCLIAALDALLVSGWLSPNLLGQLFIVMQAIAVGVFAELEFIGLRRSADALAAR